MASSAPGRNLRGLLENRALGAVLVAASAFIIYVGLPGRWDDVGLWDPDEIAVADEARALLAPEPAGAPPGAAVPGAAGTAGGTAGATSATALPRTAAGAAAGAATARPAPRLGPSLVALGVQIFGVNARAGRPMIALVAALTLAAVFLAMGPLLGRRGALLAVAFAGGAPLFILHARQLLGDAPFTFAVGVAFLCSCFFVLLEKPLHRAAAAAGWVLALWLCWRSHGVTGVLVPLVGALAGVAADLRPARRLDPVRVGALVLLGGAVALAGWRAFGLVRALDVAGAGAAGVAARAAALSALGAAPGTVPADLAYDWVFEQIGLGFAPWSALLPLVAAVALAGSRPAGAAGAPAAAAAPPPAQAAPAAAAAPPPAQAAPAAAAAPPALAAPAAAAAPPPDDRPARLALHGLVWAIAGAVVLGTIGRFARIPHAPIIVPLAVATAAAFEEVVARRAVPALFAFFALAFGVLLARDLAGYPDAVLRLLVPFGTPKLPDEFTDDFAPRIGFLVFGLAWALAATTIAIDPAVALARRGRDALRAALRANRETPAPALRLPAAAPAALARAAARVPIGWAVRTTRAAGILAGHAARVARVHAAWLLPALGLGLGCYTALVFLPAASAHLSQQGVYATYHRLAAPGEEIAAFGVRGGGADYYLGGAVRTLPTQADFLTYLKAPERRFVLVTASGLATLHIAAEKEGLHIFVLDDSNANQLLVSNKLLPGEEDRNVISKFVAKAPPAKGTYVEVNADLEGKLAVLGYTLDKTEVTRGGSFTLSLHLEVKERLGRDYKVFYHVEGPGERMKGDHAPVDAKYPTRFWQPGDFVTDRYTFKVGFSQPGGTYTIWTGFYYDGANDDSRLKVRSPGSGATDGLNRLAVAKIVVR